MTKPPPVPDTPEALAIKRFLYNNFWPLSALFMKNPNPPRKVLSKEERVQEVLDFVGDIAQAAQQPRRGKRRGWDTRSTEEKDFERHGVHGQHYWEPYLDPHGNAK